MATDGIDKNYLGDSLGGELGGALAAAEASTSIPTTSPSSASHDSPTVNFVLMTRKGNKPQFKSLAVPSDSELALNLRNREEVRRISVHNVDPITHPFICLQAEKAEKERVKKLTLDFNERQEEEEFQDLYSGVSRR